ncbi:Ribonuclease H-like domain containing protein [Parasponia andersonii]|uniref:Ribonuclease H-like domain containing protein n=1 Tax=Parasponia andersonii TaxID=3476 RepID=A0A2P5CM34_PARAD|nr:Ribonuclease H-like domain containing protein [Parasponia andersonii]
MENSSWDLLILRSVALPCRLKNPPRITHCQWSPPLLGWVKVNVDGCARGQLGLIAARGILRNSSEPVLGYFASKLENGFSFEAEFVTTIIAIEITSQRNWVFLRLESDAIYILRLLTSHSLQVPWYLPHLS